MIKDNPIIKSVFIILLFVYLVCAIYMLIAGVNIKYLIGNFVEAWILVIGITGFGFFLSLSIISGTKRYRLQQILSKNGNGRYGTTQGLLPNGKPLTIDTISLKRDLPVELQQWVINSERAFPTQVEIFIKLCGILKHHVNLPVSSDSDVSIYAHSIKVTSKLLEYSILSAEDCNQLLIKNKFLSPKNFKYLYLNDIQANNLLVILGIAHDVGKIDAFEVIDSKLTYLDCHPKKARLIVSRIDAFWKLPENLRDAVTFALGYYLEFNNRPKHYKDGGLVSTSIIGDLLIYLLVCAHNEVASFEQIELPHVVINNDIQKSKVEIEEIIEDEVLITPLIPTNKLDTNKSTKKRNKSPINSDPNILKSNATVSNVKQLDKSITEDRFVKISTIIKPVVIENVELNSAKDQNKEMLLTEAFRNDK